MVWGIGYFTSWLIRSIVIRFLSTKASKNYDKFVEPLQSSMLATGRAILIAFSLMLSNDIQHVMSLFNLVKCAGGTKCQSGNG